jgi:hypothetical protein
VFSSWWSLLRVRIRVPTCLFATERRPPASSTLRCCFSGQFLQTSGLFSPKNLIFQSLSIENKTKLPENLDRFHYALKHLGATKHEVNSLWSSLARVLDLRDILFAKVKAYLKSTLDIDLCQGPAHASRLLNTFNDVSNPVLNEKRCCYFEAIEIITNIVQRYSQSCVIIEVLHFVILEHSKAKELTAQLQWCLSTHQL